MTANAWPPSAFIEGIALSFAIECDECRLTTTDADRLVEAIHDALSIAADNRRDALSSYAPELIDD